MKLKLSRSVCVCVVLISLWAGAGSTASRAVASPNRPAATAVTEHLSIPAAALKQVDTRFTVYDFENHGRYLIHRAPDVTSTYVAGVQLPHSVTITRVTACFYDNAMLKSGEARLLRVQQDGSRTIAQMASITSDGVNNYGTPADDTILYPVVDNTDYTYQVMALLPSSVAGTSNQVWSCGVTIDYTPPATATGALSLVGAAFRPFEDDTHYFTGSYVFHYASSGYTTTNGVYLAPLNLPQGAVLNKLTFYYEDNVPTKTMTARLQRTNLHGAFQTMTTVQSTDAMTTPVTTTAFTYNTIDNTNYAYWALYDLPATTGLTTTAKLNAWSLVLEYSQPAATRSGVVAISNAAFNGFHDGYDYENHGRWLLHLHGEGGSTARGVYLAPVTLPHGVAVTKMTTYFYDGSSTESGSAMLVRTKAGENQTLAYAASTGNSGYETQIDATIDNGGVDNAQYAYFVYWDLPVSVAPIGTGDVAGCGVVIEYEYRFVYLPLVMR